jgi:crotonobetainyl-CoA:carnitine CoA-transferase CaiB-like acyl-CoA transferase
MLDYVGKTYDEPCGWEALGTSALQRFYQAQDGWFFLGATPSEVGRLGTVVGQEGLASADDAELANVLERAFAQDARGAWVHRLRAADISAQVVVRLPELMADPWVREHGLAVTHQVEGVGEVTYPGPSPRLSETPARVGQAASQPGADAASVLAEVGLADAIPSLERQWVLQTTDLPRAW